MQIYPPEQYQEQLQSLFDTYLQQIQTLLPQARVEHIGSSAIPGAWSRADLDILLCVPEQAFDQTIQLLKRLHFREKVATSKRSELCILEAINTQEDVEIYLVAENSYLLNFIDFRDILRGQPKLVDAYNNLKKSSQDLNEDEYRNRKTQFIESVLQQYLT